MSEYASSEISMLDQSYILMYSAFLTLSLGLCFQTWCQSFETHVISCNSEDTRNSFEIMLQIIAGLICS